MLRDVGKFFSRCGIMNVKYIYREGNWAVDWVTVDGYGFNNFMNWIISLLLELDSILKADRVFWVGYFRF